MARVPTPVPEAQKRGETSRGVHQAGESLSAAPDAQSLAEALACADREIALNPRDPDAFNRRGTALKRLQRFEEALASYDTAITLSPDYAEAFNNRGTVLKELGRLDDALASYDRALDLDPRRHDARNNRGVVLKNLQRIDDALASYDGAIAVKPDFFEAHNNRGVALKQLDRLDEALESFERSIAINPVYAPAFFSRGNVLIELKRIDEAIASYDRGLSLKPGVADALMNRGIAKLLAGRYVEGWQDYEWRSKTNALSRNWPRMDAPEWQGDDIAGRRIAVHAEQGLGDTIQFARYLSLLIELGATVKLLVPPKLRRLLNGLGLQIEMPSSIKRGDVDVHCSLLSLPLRLGTEENSIPDEVPYLKPEEERVHHWTQALGDHGFKIGIVWQGRPNRDIDRGRSIPLAEFVPLARLRGVRLISLQKKDGLDQLPDLPNDVTIETLGENFDSGPDAFIDCAAVMAHLDLIITSDTSTAHLAGALGRPTWLALKYVPDWRWLLDRDDSPWYPTMRLFRQRSNGDWGSVFSRIVRELQPLPGSRFHSPDPQDTRKS